MNKEAAAAVEKQAAVLTSSKAPAPASASQNSRSLSAEEIARRLITKRVYDARPPRNGVERNPARLSFTSVQVTPNGNDTFAVNAKYTIRLYYDDRTSASNREEHFLLSKSAGAWRLQKDQVSTADQSVV